ncbi:hypothetical protein ACFWAP_00895 [Streptomyces goshikiensis]|uniref:hypothetical protein n=1 Tax=Streptomyces goshikiensis TaxID=1942 RepID=UPI0036666BB6
MKTTLDPRCMFKRGEYGEYEVRYGKDWYTATFRVGTVWKDQKTKRWCGQAVIRLEHGRKVHTTKIDVKDCTTRGDAATALEAAWQVVEPARTEAAPNFELISEEIAAREQS